MATWTFWGWTSTAGGLSTSATQDSAYSIDTDSALVFGGGSRSDFQSNISLNSWNTSMHIGQDSSDASVDMCHDQHLHALTPISGWSEGTRDTASMRDGEYINLRPESGDRVSHSSDGIGLRFVHDFSVKCNPVYIWAGTGTAVDNPPNDCHIAMCELSTATSNTEWATVTPTSKLTLSSHLDSAEEHWWCVGIAVNPTDVGHKGDNQMKVEVTYY